MSDVGVTSDVVVNKKARKSYKEVEEDEFEDEQEEEEAGGHNGVNGDNGDEGDDDEELGEDEYVVEKIFSHYIADDVRQHERSWLLPLPQYSTGLTA